MLRAASEGRDEHLENGGAARLDLVVVAAAAAAAAWKRRPRETEQAHD
jgi:hypothetical protein